MTCYQMLIFLATIDLCYIYVDRPVAEWVTSLGSWIIEAFEIITRLGCSSNWLVPIAVTVPITTAARYGLHRGLLASIWGWITGVSCFIFMAIVSSGLFCDLVKLLVGRSRPKLLYESSIYSFNAFSTEAVWHSFPSGHTVTIFALAAAIKCLVPRWQYYLYSIAGVVAASRVIVGAHFVSDVVAGSVIGIAVTDMLCHWFASRRWVFEHDKNGCIRVQRVSRFILGKIRSFVKLD
jgi:undecaprenyl-diphosphatase